MRELDKEQTNREDLTLAQIEKRRAAFGENMRGIRETVGMSKQELTQLTRISPPFVDALESGRFDQLPGEVFGRGFIRNICKQLNKPSELLVAEFNACFSQNEKPIERKRSVRGLNHGPDSKLIKTFKKYFSSRFFIRKLVVPVFSLVVLVVVVAQAFKPKSASQENAKEELNLNDVSVNSQAASTTFPEIPVDLSSKEADAEQGVKELQSSTTTRPSEAEKTSKSAQDVFQSSTLTDGFEKEPGNMAKKPAMPASVSVKSVTPKEDRLTLEQVEKSDPAASVGMQKLEITVNEKVTIKHRLDKQDYQTKEYEPGNYSFSFTDKIDCYIFDMGAVSLKYNDQELGQIGKKGQQRKLSFSSKLADGAKL